MNDVSRPLHGALQRFTIEQISLDELKLLKQVTVGFAQRINLLSVCLTANSTANAITSILKQLKSYMTSQEA